MSSRNTFKCTRVPGTVSVPEMGPRKVVSPRLGTMMGWGSLETQVQVGTEMVVQS